jgi:hyperosmotically inducible periplasmic protein
MAEKTGPLRKAVPPRWSVAVAAGLLALAPLSATLVTAGDSPASDTPAGASNVTEARLELSVRAALLEKLGEDAIHITVRASGNKVALSGEVADRATQHLAEEVALSVPGVKAVDNHIKLASARPAGAKVQKTMRKAGLKVKDKLLEVKVKLRLLDHIGVEAFKIEVEAAEHEVSLRGHVPNENYHRLALQVANTTHGVRKVIDLLSVS